jgi:crotonobetainyl-CoA:carnitine CoA-transferase CaiB-like acyl-CoA transferase
MHNYSGQMQVEEGLAVLRMEGPQAAPDADAAQPWRPLAGVRVVELTGWVAGPQAGVILGDLGADVVKVESPHAPDPTRSHTAAQGLSMRTASGHLMCWETFNRNKRSLALDLSTNEGQRVLYQLVAKSDVFLTNMRTTALERLGASFDRLKTANPSLVYGVAGGLGSKGPRANDPVVDAIGMAYSGFMYAVSARQDEPWYPHGSLTDIQTGTMVAFGIVTALFARSSTNEAQYVHSSQLQSMMWLQNFNIAMAANNGTMFDAHVYASPAFSVYQCGDGEWIALALIHGDSPVRSPWPVLFKLFGKPELTDDPRFASDAVRDLHRDELKAVLISGFEQRERDYWVDTLQSADIMCSGIKRVTDVVSDEHVAAEGYIFQLDNGLKFMRSCFELGDVPTKGAPDLGADTHEVLLDLGLSEDEIISLHLADVVM